MLQISQQGLTARIEVWRSKRPKSVSYMPFTECFIVDSYLEARSVSIAPSVKLLRSALCEHSSFREVSNGFPPDRSAKRGARINRIWPQEFIVSKSHVIVRALTAHQTPISVSCKETGDLSGKFRNNTGFYPGILHSHLR